MEVRSSENATISAGGILKSSRALEAHGGGKRQEGWKGFTLLSYLIMFSDFSAHISPYSVVGVEDE